MNNKVPNPSNIVRLILLLSAQHFTKYDTYKLLISSHFK